MTAGTPSQQPTKLSELSPCEVCAPRMVAVLVCGGSGYLGQFLVQHLAASGHAVAYTYATRELPPGALGADVISVQADMVTGEGLDAALSCLSQPLDVVVNAIAISQVK